MPVPQIRVDELIERHALFMSETVNAIAHCRDLGASREIILRAQAEYTAWFKTRGVELVLPPAAHDALASTMDVNAALQPRAGMATASIVFDVLYERRFWETVNYIIINECQEGRPLWPIPKHFARLSNDS